MDSRAFFVLIAIVTPASLLGLFAVRAWRTRRLTPDEIDRRRVERDIRFLQKHLRKQAMRVHGYRQVIIPDGYNSDAGTIAARARCKSGEELTLKHEPDDIHGPDAVAVYSPRLNVRLGFLPEQLATQTLEAWERGLQHSVYFDQEQTDPATGFRTGSVLLYITLDPKSDARAA